MPIRARGADRGGARRRRCDARRWSCIKRFRYADDESTDYESHRCVRSRDGRRILLWMPARAGGTPMSEEEWIDVAAAAERYHCSTWKIGRWIKQRALETRVETAIDPDGRWVITTWLRVRELDDVSGVTAREVHVRKIRATAQPLKIGRASCRDRKKVTERG